MDDEASISSSLQAILREEGWRADALPSGEDCLKAANKNRYDLVLLDGWLQGIDGLEVLRQLKQQEDAPVVIMISPPLKYNRDQVISPGKLSPAKVPPAIGK